MELHFKLILDLKKYAKMQTYLVCITDLLLV